MRWFMLSWWRYLLAPRRWDDEMPWWSVIWCRAKGHPYGPVWFNVGGTEPDMRCKYCGDDLG